MTLTYRCAQIKSLHYDDPKSVSDNAYLARIRPILELLLPYARTVKPVAFVRISAVSRIHESAAVALTGNCSAVARHAARRPTRPARRSTRTFTVRTPTALEAARRDRHALLGRHHRVERHTG